MKHFIKFFLILSALAVTVGLAVNQLRDKPLELLYKSKKARLAEAVERIQATEAKEAVSLELPEILDYAMMKEVIANGNAIILDSRPEVFHRLGHIPNALSLPRDDFEKNYMAMKDCIIDSLIGHREHREHREGTEDTKSSHEDTKTRKKDSDTLSSASPANKSILCEPSVASVPSVSKQLTFGEAKDYPLVLYCADSSCKDANLVFDALKKLGYTRVSIYTGGWAEWKRKK